MASVSANGCTNEIIRYIDRKISAYQHNGFTNAFQYDGYNQINHNFTNLGHTRFRATATYTANGSTKNVTVNYSNDPGVFVEYDKYGRVIKSGKDAQTIDLINIYCDNDTDTLTNVTNPNDPILKINANSPLRKRIKVNCPPEYFYYDEDGNVSKYKNGYREFNIIGNEHEFIPNNSFTFGDDPDDIIPVSVQYEYALGDLTLFGEDGTSQEYKQSKNYFVNAITNLNQTDHFIKVTENDIAGRKVQETLAVSESSILAEADAHATKTYTYYPTTITPKGVISPIQSVEYTFNSENNTLTSTESYTYDKNGNVTSITDTEENVTRYYYDSLNRLVREDNPYFDKSYVYTYDNGGNIITRSEHQNPYEWTEELSQATASVSYSYDSTWKDKLISYGGSSITYDSYGNPTTYKGNNLIWNRVNHLLQYGNKATFTYNGLGQIVQKVYGDTTAIYDYDQDGRLLREVHNNDSETNYYTIVYIYSGNEVVGFGYSEVPEEETLHTFTYQKNIFGDVIGIYQNNVDLVASYRYDAWGNCSIIPANVISSVQEKFTRIANRNPYRYRGYYYDKELSLYHLQTRYYDPETGRFISPDTIEYLDPKNIGGLNLYCYCGNNPIMYTDPSGHMPKWAQWLIGGVLLAGSIALTIATGGAAAGTILATVHTIATGAMIGGITSAAIGTIAGGISYENGVAVWDWRGAAEGFMWGSITGVISGAVGAALSNVGSGLASYGKLGKLGYAGIQGLINSGIASGLTAGQGLIAGGFSWDSVGLSAIFGFAGGAIGVTKWGVGIRNVIVGTGLGLGESSIGEIIEWWQSSPQTNMSCLRFAY